MPYCFEHDIVRIGWPDTGDLLLGNRAGALANGCDLNGLPPHVWNYLEAFLDIRLGSIILVPNKDAIGNIYIGEVIRTYHYFHDVPLHPFECAHRVGVRWDRDHEGAPIPYYARDLAISIHGGFWSRALYEISTSPRSEVIIPKINRARQRSCFPETGVTGPVDVYFLENQILRSYM